MAQFDNSALYVIGHLIEDTVLSSSVPSLHKSLQSRQLQSRNPRAARVRRQMCLQRASPTAEQGSACLQATSHPTFPHLTLEDVSENKNLGARRDIQT